MLRAHLLVRSVDARALSELAASVLLRLAVLVLVALVADVSPMDALRALGRDQSHLGGDAVSLIAIRLRGVRVLPLILGEARRVQVRAVPFVLLVQVPRIEMRDRAPTLGLSILGRALESRVLRTGSFALMLSDLFPIFLLAGHFLLPFADFGLLGPAQIHGTALIRVLLVFLLFVSLLQILISVTLLHSLAAIGT